MLHVLMLEASMTETCPQSFASTVAEALARLVYQYWLD